MEASSTAEARLDAAMRRAFEAGRLDSWLRSASVLLEVSEKAGRPPERLRELRRTMRAQADSLRCEYRSRVGRLWAAQLLDGHLGDLLRRDLEEGALHAGELFEAVEMMKARTLLDQLTGRSSPFPDPGQAAQAAELEQAIMRFEPREDRDAASSELSLSSLLPLQPRPEAEGRGATLEEVERLYAEAGAGFDGVQPVAELERVMAALEPDEALIEYVIPYHWSHPAIGIWMLVVTREGVALAEAPTEALPDAGFIGRVTVGDSEPVDVSPLASVVITLRIAIREGRDADAQRNLEGLHGLLVEPLLAAGVLETAKRWIVVPQSVLHYIPWAALTDRAGRRLTEDIAIALAPSASVWLELRARPPQTVTSFLGIADPAIADTPLPRLPNAKKELKRIEGQLDGLERLTLSDGDATEAALRSQVGGRGIVHFATHGEFPEDNPLDFHRLLLAADSAHDGRLEADELRGLDFRSAWLVALSICDGGLFRFGAGDEPLGLIAALLSAGASNVVGTLWPIEDDAGRDFMADFYDGVLGRPPAETLRRTHASFADNTILRRWAAFQLVGAGLAPVVSD